MNLGDPKVLSNFERTDILRLESEATESVVAELIKLDKLLRYSLVNAFCCKSLVSIKVSNHSRKKHSRETSSSF